MADLQTNNELNNAWRFVETTGTSIFLTGKAGTGKTTFLRNLRKESRKTMIVVAPTGVAAINAGGVTIHSFFQLPFSPYIPGTEVKDKYNFSKDKIKIIRALDLLVIDEISMVRSDLLDAIDHVLRKYRRSSEPFGGVQLLMIGDLQQLTPVVTPADEAMLRGYYDTPYFFGSRALSGVDYVTIQLTKVFRQQDQTFVNLLNAVRENRVTSTDLQVLNSRLNPSFRPSRQSDYIRLTTHNATADDYNRTQLLLLKSPARKFSAAIQGIFPEYSYPTESELTLKVGAQVMFVRNDTEHGYYNGLIGHITDFNDNEILVRCPNQEAPIVVTPQEWENTKYTVNEKTQEIEAEVQGTFTQYPLKLAWAITIHKSQGLTFEHAVIDAGASFAPGQVYVALSRCKTLEGMVLSTPITPQAILSDYRVENYISNQENEARRSIARLPEIEKAYYRDLLLRLFDFRDILGLQERLARLLAESFHNMFPTVTRKEGKTVEILQKGISDVTWKWGNMIRTLPFEQLKSEAFQQRIRRSAEYFIKELTSNIEDRKNEVMTVKSGNKAVMKRLNTIREDLYASLREKLRLLGKISSEGFDTDKYLRFKQQSLLAPEPRTEFKAPSRSDYQEGAYDKEMPVRERKKPKEKKEKEPKIPSHELTYNRFREGVSIEEIARERNLKTTTIKSHLENYLASGAIRLDEIVPPENIRTIERAIERHGMDKTVNELKEFLPESILAEDVYPVLRAYRERHKGE